jgi:hypothetical protein
LLSSNTLALWRCAITPSIGKTISTRQRPASEAMLKPQAITLNKLNKQYKQKDFFLMTLSKTQTMGIV